MLLHVRVKQYTLAYGTMDITRMQHATSHCHYQHGALLLTGQADPDPDLAGGFCFFKLPCVFVSPLLFRLFRFRSYFGFCLCIYRVVCCHVPCCRVFSCISPGVACALVHLAVIQHVSIAIILCAREALSVRMCCFLFSLLLLSSSSF